MAPSTLYNERVKNKFQCQRLSMESHAIFDLSAEDWLRRLKNEGSFILIIRTHTLWSFFL